MTRSNGMMERCGARAECGRSGIALALLAAAALAGCGGGSGDGGDDGGAAPDDGVPDTGVSAPGSSLAEGEPPDVPLASGTARGFAIDVSELNDALHFLAVVLPPEIAAADGGCDGGGTRAVSVEGDVRRVAFDDCALSGNDAVRLDGTASAASGDGGTELLGLDGLTVRSGALAVTASGRLRLAPDGDRLAVTLDGAALDVDDSQGAFVVTAVDVTLPAAGNAGEASVAYAVDSTRAGAAATVASDGALAFDGTLGCPTGGTLRVAVDDDGGELALVGAPGGNVALGGDFGDDTLACSEIGRLVPASSGFLPPPVPGG